MAAPPTVATAEGSLYELVSRGNKDVYFFQDLPDSKFLFDFVYEPQVPSSADLRRIPPRTAVEFGRMVEFDFDLVGDSMISPTLLIQLPSWLPPSVASKVNTSIITDVSGNTYGYTNGIGYFLFETIQIYQDNILLQEFSGDYLWASSSITGTYAQTGVYNQITGQHNGSSLSIARNAAPSLLRLELPVLGCQGSSDPGFPQRAATQHSYRLKCKLRKLIDLVESSDGQVKPSPWGRSDFLQTLSATSEPISFSTLTRESMLPLNLQLETRQIYFPLSYQESMQKNPQRIPFKRIYETIFTQNHFDYAGLSTGGTATVNRRLEGRHPTTKLLWFFRSTLALQKNQLWNLFPGFSNLSLTIAGQTREYPRTPRVWSDLTNFSKEQIDSGDSIYTMNWGLGSIPPGRFGSSIAHNEVPTGTVNFTTADKPTFYISLTLPPDGSTSSELRVFVEGWSIFQTDGQGRAEQFSLN
jgi:hypothetical protein